MNRRSGVQSAPFMIYVHVPFCPRKCGYCDFYSGPAEGSAIRKYFEDVRREIRENPFARPYDSAEGKEKIRISSVFFGGGTPSFVPAEEIASVLDLLRDCFELLPDAEISMEANPGSLTPEKCLVYRESGVNRLSLGLQSADDRLLRTIGRIHDFQAFLESYRMARKAGFDNVNVDLISGLPNDSVGNFEKGLRKVLELRPEHISVYSLIVAENTPFYELYGPSGPRVLDLPSEEEERTMYVRTGEILGDSGYHRYEISNYALPGRECRHNTGYWTHVPYLGFGAAAASFVPDESGSSMLRYKNAGSADYLNMPYEEQEVLRDGDFIREYMILKLRMTEGVSEEEFRRRFGRGLFETFPDEIGKCVREGLLACTGKQGTEDRFRDDAPPSGIRLTDKGLDLANLVFEEFL